MILGMSAVAILRPDGAYEIFKAVLQMGQALREQWSNARKEEAIRVCHNNAISVLSMICSTFHGNAW